MDPSWTHPGVPWPPVRSTPATDGRNPRRAEGMARPRPCSLGRIVLPRKGGPMTTFVLVPGAGGQAWYWHRVVPRLRFRGHEAVAVDLPSGDPGARLEDYVRAVVAAVPPGVTRSASGEGLAVVGQSLGGLVAPLVADRVGADLVVLVCAMVPLPGETGGQWWEATGQGEAMRRFAVQEGRDRDDT